MRVCDSCMVDVKRGNYFTMRRYLTPLQLYDPDAGGGGRGGAIAAASATATATKAGGGSGEATREITSQTVAASLSSLSADVDAMIHDPTAIGEKMTIPARVLVPAVGRHLRDRANTAEYAVRVLAGLLVLGSVSGDDSYAAAPLAGGPAK